ncbi:MAG: IS200/IS605 family transposase [Xenococcaceae cyanobacterium MO_167.B27]|nr:IS200/IS605 family transposase [Xenococcaceae cyanobacterium MO_167.B27]
MAKAKYRSSRRSVFNLTVHIVFVTKYRRKIIDTLMLEELRRVFQSVCISWDCELIEFNGESDHVHLARIFSTSKKTK